MFQSPLGKCTFGVGALLIAIWIAEIALGERFGATALLLYLPQHGWGLPPLVLLVWALRRRRIGVALLNAGFVLFWTHFLLGTRFPSVFQRGSDSNRGRLMTYNIERGAGGIDALERAIRAQKPEIVCLQESQGIKSGRAFAPGARIAARFPGWSVAQSGDVLTLSRFPMSSQRSTPLRGTRRILETTLETPLGRVRVLNVHVSTSFSAQSRTQNGAKMGRIGRIFQIIAYAQPSAQERLEQIAPLRRAIDRDPTTPLLVAGDFNSPPRGLFYRAISRELEDAWASGGRGVGHTFPARFPVLPIDHVLAAGLSVERAFVPDVRASDHRPLIVDFTFKPD